MYYCEEAFIIFPTTDEKEARKLTQINTDAESNNVMIVFQDKSYEKKENLCRYVQENTEKLNLLLALQEEKNKLEKILRSQRLRQVSNK